MERVTLMLPEPIRSSLPEDGESAATDMERAVAGWERRINRTIEDAEDDEAAAGAVVDVIERFEDRWERYDEFVVELRAWGQSPIYAMAWRDLHAALIQQLYDHEGLAEHVDRERNARILENGIRPS